MVEVDRVAARRLLEGEVFWAVDKGRFFFACAILGFECYWYGFGGVPDGFTFGAVSGDFLREAVRVECRGLVEFGLFGAFFSFGASEVSGLVVSVGGCGFSVFGFELGALSVFVVFVFRGGAFFELVGFVVDVAGFAFDLGGIVAFVVGVGVAVVFDEPVVFVEDARDVFGFFAFREFLDGFDDLAVCVAFVYGARVY